MARKEKRMTRKDGTVEAMALPEMKPRDIFAAIILAGLRASPKNKDCVDQSILNATRMADRLLEALENPSPITDDLYKRYEAEAVKKTAEAQQVDVREVAVPMFPVRRPWERFY
jgi:hypothetical protein